MSIRPPLSFVCAASLVGCAIKPAFHPTNQLASDPHYGIAHAFHARASDVREVYADLPLVDGMFKLAVEENQRRQVCAKPLRLISKEPTFYKGGTVSIRVFCPMP